MSQTIRTIISICLLVSIVFFISLQVLFQPSHNREWEIGHERLPIVTFTESGEVTVQNYRNFDWYEEYQANSHYETLIFNEADIKTVDVIISNFAEFQGLAHIFLSFGLQDGTQIALSLETRREKDETFSPILGVLRQYEIIYVVGSERDLVGARTGPRNERVYLYPTMATSEQAQALFRRLSEDINDVATTPRMYNTLTRNCTNEITRRVEEIVALDFPLSYKSILPGYFDEILYDMGIIATDGTFEAVKERHRIDNTATDRNLPTYSADLRAQLR